MLEFLLGGAIRADLKGLHSISCGTLSPDSLALLLPLYLAVENLCSSRRSFVLVTDRVLHVSFLSLEYAFCPDDNFVAATRTES